MNKAIIRLYYTAGGFGDVICWRLESQFCHATIELDGVVYSATFPKVIGVNVTDTKHPNYKDVMFPPRKGKEYTIDLTDDEAAKAIAYCKSKIGTSYDILSALGWLLRIGSLRWRKHVYCFEYVYGALTAAKIFPQSKALITGDQLLVDLYHSGKLENLDPHTYSVSLKQRQPK